MKKVINGWILKDRTWKFRSNKEIYHKNKKCHVRLGIGGWYFMVSPFELE